MVYKLDLEALQPRMMDQLHTVMNQLDACNRHLCARVFAIHLWACEDTSSWCVHGVLWAWVINIHRCQQQQQQLQATANSAAAPPCAGSRAARLAVNLNAGARGVRALHAYICTHFTYKHPCHLYKTQHHHNHKYNYHTSAHYRGPSSQGHMYGSSRSTTGPHLLQRPLHRLQEILVPRQYNDQRG